MVYIEPFIAVHPLPELSQRVACPPYDVLTPEQAAELERDPLSFVSVVRPKEGVHESARSNLERLSALGVLVEEDEPSFYSYTIQMQGCRMHGLAAAFSVKDYLEGRIKRHEHTRHAKVADRLQHLKVAGAQTGVAFLVHPGSPVVEDALDKAEKCKPVFSARDKYGATHTVERIASGRPTERIATAFESLDSVYIADGHHRVQACAELSLERKDSSGTFLAVSFPSHQVLILGYHRYVEPSGVPQGFLDELAQRFEIEELTAAMEHPGTTSAGKILVLAESRVFQLDFSALMASHGGGTRKLAADFLQQEILGPMLGIDDPRTDPRLRFIGGPGSESELASLCSQRGGVGFVLPPVTIDYIMERADRGKVMPPKSTWFHPKVLSGLLVKPLE